MVLAFSQVSFCLLATSYVGQDKAGILFASVGREKELIRMWQVSVLSDTAHVISLSLLGNGRSMCVKQDFMCIVQPMRTNGLIMGCLLLFRFWLASTVKVHWSRSTEAHWLILMLDVSWQVLKLIFHSAHNLLHCCLKVYLCTYCKHSQMSSWLHFSEKMDRNVHAFRGKKKGVSGWGGRLWYG